VTMDLPYRAATTVLNSALTCSSDFASSNFKGQRPFAHVIL